MGYAKTKQAELVAKCRELGLRVDLTPNGHWKVYAPLGPVYMPATASDSQAGWKKDRSRLRRHGVPL